VATNDKLREYRSRRDFRRTREPRGGERKPGAKPIFVIQKHDASSLHYDFRLEVDGVLKSWAVPKGPSTDPTVKRLAVPTEDHPLDYADFEGVIPEGAYGAGPVLIWDAGTYRNLRADKENDGASMEESLRDGKVEVWLDGKKLKGGYVLIRTGIRDDANWLLFKKDDDQADARRKPVSTEPASVVSGKTLKEIEKENRKAD
jgi:DNA ligase D-like protein (predicted 3'-phosphoesterase)